MADLYDVVAVNIATHAVRVLERDLDDESANAVVCMAVMRRGVETEFFADVSAGMYRDGDKWRGNGNA